MLMLLLMLLLMLQLLLLLLLLPLYESPNLLLSWARDVTIDAM